MLVIDNALPEHLIRSAIAAWPAKDWTGWHRYKNATADKYGSLHGSLIPAACRIALEQLALRVGDHLGSSFVDYEYHAAGLHQLPPGGFLGRHLDAVKHPLRPWQRTHSVVLFLDTIIASGQLIVEDQEIPSVSNRAVIFRTDNCWHAVLPTKHWRRSLALFAWRETSDTIGSTTATFEVRNERNRDTTDSCCGGDTCGTRPCSGR